MIKPPKYIYILIFVVVFLILLYLKKTKNKNKDETDTTKPEKTNTPENKYKGYFVYPGCNQPKEVRSLQKLLNQNKRAGLVEDGVFGNKTLAVLQKYGYPTKMTKTVYDDFMTKLIMKSI